MIKLKCVYVGTINGPVQNYGFQEKRSETKWLNFCFDRMQKAEKEHQTCKFFH